MATLDPLVCPPPPPAMSQHSSRMTAQCGEGWDSWLAGHSPGDSPGAGAVLLASSHPRGVAVGTGILCRWHPPPSPSCPCCLCPVSPSSVSSTTTSSAAQTQTRHRPWFCCFPSRSGVLLVFPSKLCSVTPLLPTFSHMFLGPSQHHLSPDCPQSPSQGLPPSLASLSFVPRMAASRLLV